MRSLFVTIAVFLAANTALAYKPAVEREFRAIAAHGCNNRDGNFIEVTPRRPTTLCPTVTRALGSANPIE